MQEYSEQERMQDLEHFTEVEMLMNNIGKSVELFCSLVGDSGKPLKKQRWRDVKKGTPTKEQKPLSDEESMDRTQAQELSKEIDTDIEKFCSLVGKEGKAVQKRWNKIKERNDV